MSEADTLEKKIGVILRTKTIMQKELLFDVNFYAFLNAYLHLKMKNVEENIKHTIEKWKEEQAKGTIVKPSDVTISQRDNINTNRDGKDRIGMNDSKLVVRDSNEQPTPVPTQPD